jgi:hypothetical protein
MLKKKLTALKNGRFFTILTSLASGIAALGLKFALRGNSLL